jgi:hypothetical protein
MNIKRRIHDGISGAVIEVGADFGHWIDPMWLLFVGLLGVTVLQSVFNGFCPVYFALDEAKVEE